MVELTIVFLLIATIAALALPNLTQSIRAYNARSAANLIVQRLAAARALAMAKNEQVTVSFNRSSGKYGYDFTGAPGGGPDGIPEATDPDDTSIAYPVDSLPDSIQMVFPGDVGNIRVNFSPRGELPIGDSPQTLQIRNSYVTAAIQIDVRGKVWISSLSSTH